MASKSGFSKFEAKGTIGGSLSPAQKPPAPGLPAVPGPAQPSGPRIPDRNRCPNGWDQQVWHLTLLFEQYADADGIRLRAGRPVIYAEVSDLVKRWNMREKSGNGNYAQEVHGCARRELGDDVAARCWYHWPPKDPSRQARRVITWVEMTEVIMAELWSRVMDEYALDHFRQHFAEYGMECTRHWKSLQIIREIDARPKIGRPVMRRVVRGGTMAADSKEG